MPKLKPNHLKSNLQKVPISNGRISDPHCAQNVNKKSGFRMLKHSKTGFFSKLLVECRLKSRQRICQTNRVTMYKPYTNKSNFQMPLVFQHSNNNCLLVQYCGAPNTEHSVNKDRHWYPARMAVWSNASIR